MSREQDNCASSIPKNEKIALSNDALRRHGRGGKVRVTRGVTSLDGFSAAELLSLVATYDSFDAGDDPYGERDFGAIEYRGAKLFWKIDYFAPDSKWMVASSDPANPNLTERLLTIMLAEEY